MDKDQLRKQIDIILNDERAKVKREDYEKFYVWKSEGDESLTSLPSIDPYNGFYAPPAELPDIDKIGLEYPNLDLLLRLYESVKFSPELSKYFIDYLSHYVILDDSASYLVIEALIKIGELDRIIDRINLYNVHRILPVCNVLDELLYFEYYIFSEKQLEKLETNVNNVLESQALKAMSVGREMLEDVCKTILERIHVIRYSALKNALKEGTNFQIETDRNKIKEKISFFGFDPVLVASLDKMEEMYWDFSTDEFDNSMAMGQLREFFTRLVRNICQKIKEKTGKPYPNTESTKIANLRKYMKEHLQLDEEHQLMNKLIEMINHKGSHNLVSEREYFRVTKNIGIEISKLLLTKLEKFLAE